MGQHKRIITWASSTIFAVLSLLFIPTHHAIADAYLDALNAEATGEEKPSDQSVLESDWSHQKQSLKTQLTPGLSKAVFEAELKDSFYGSFVFYNKLNDVKKDVVYKHYQETGDIEAVRQKIMDMLSGN